MLTRKFITGIGIAVVLLSVGIHKFLQTTPALAPLEIPLVVSQPDSISPTPMNNGIQEEDMGNGWTKYTDTNYNFSIEYPKGWYKDIENNARSTCFTEYSSEGRPIQNYPMVCVTLNPTYLRVSNDYVSSALEYIKHLQKQPISSSTYADRGQQLVTKKFIVSGYEAIEEVHGEPEGDTERSYYVSTYVAANDAVFQVIAITFTQDQFKEYEQLLRHITNSFIVLN